MNNDIACKKGMQNLKMDEWYSSTTRIGDKTANNRYLCNIPGIFCIKNSKEEMLITRTGATYNPGHNFNVLSVAKESQNERKHSTYSLHCLME